jgi:hypothetical protein
MQMVLSCIEINYCGIGIYVWAWSVYERITVSWSVERNE